MKNIDTQHKMLKHLSYVYQKYDYQKILAKLLPNYWS